MKVTCFLILSAAAPELFEEKKRRREGEDRRTSDRREEREKREREGRERERERKSLGCLSRSSYHYGEAGR